MIRMIVVGCGTPDKTLTKAIFFVNQDMSAGELNELINDGTNIPEPEIQGSYVVTDNVLDTVYENMAYEG